MVWEMRVCFLTFPPNAFDASHLILFAHDATEGVGAAQTYCSGTPVSPEPGVGSQRDEFLLKSTQYFLFTARQI